MTVAQKRAKCKSKGMVLDKTTKRCRKSRAGKRRSVKRSPFYKHRSKPLPKPVKKSKPLPNPMDYMV